VITVNYVKMADELKWGRGKILVPELVVKHNITGGTADSFHAMIISVKPAHHTCPNSCCFSVR
jgi:hypothetical protein